MLSRTPCRIRGADNEHTPERPVRTLAQVFDLAELLGGRSGTSASSPPADSVCATANRTARCAPLP
jgi:hypothetical protein